MKITLFCLSLLCLSFAGIATFAQQQNTGFAKKAATPAPSLKTAPSAAQVQQNVQYQMAQKNAIERSAAKDNSQGTITLNFGVVKQGESVTTFFPFNIKTLQTTVSTATESLELKDFQRFVHFENPSAITDVKLAFRNGALQNIILASGVNGNGFNVTYRPTTQSGAVDESIMVYTTKGNIMLRLIGYVYSEKDVVTVKK